VENLLIPKQDQLGYVIHALIKPEEDINQKGNGYEKQ